MTTDTRDDMFSTIRKNLEQQTYANTLWKQHVEEIDASS